MRAWHRIAYSRYGHASVAFNISNPDIRKDEFHSILLEEKKETNCLGEREEN